MNKLAIALLFIATTSWAGYKDCSKYEYRGSSTQKEIRWRTLFVGGHRVDNTWTASAPGIYSDRFKKNTDDANRRNARRRVRACEKRNERREYRERKKEEREEARQKKKEELKERKRKREEEREKRKADKEKKRKERCERVRRKRPTPNIPHDCRRK